MAGTYETISRDIRQVVSDWKGTVPLEWDNRGDLDPDALEKSEVWARVFILPGDAERTLSGAPIGRRYSGLVEVQVFARSGEGTAGALELVDSIVSLFQSPGVSGMSFSEPQVGRGIDDDHGWTNWSVTAPFWRWEVS